MIEIELVPGIVTSPDPITIPVGMPDIDDVVSSEIWRLPRALGLDPHTQAQIRAAIAVSHPQADIVAALAPHGVHNHRVDLTTATADAPATRVQATGPGGPAGYDGGGVTVAGGAGGVMDNLVAQAHGDGATAVPHTAGVAEVAHAGAAALIEAAAPLKLTQRTFRLSVDTELGDILTLIYLEQGARLRPA